MIFDEPVRYSPKSGEILLESLLILCVSSVIGGIFPKGELACMVGLVAAGVNVLRIWFSGPLRTLFDHLFTWRWAIALAVFTLMVALQLHTSNSASYASILDPGPTVDDSILFGYPKLFRTDEYAVQLPYYFSQIYNGFEEISYQMSIGGQDMIVGYNAPVLSPTLIGKPFIWGYLLFGNAYGLSWYFSSKIILMFMVALELFRIVTRKRMLSVFGAFLLTFAPAMQWWFSPHFYDVIFWSCTLFVVGYWFFASTGGKKWGFTLLAIASLVGFVLALFPSLQVPCGVLMLFLMAACLFRDRQHLVWKWADLLNVAVVLLGVAAILVPALLEMGPALELLAETEYPGSRISVGGYGRDWMLFLNIVSVFQPLSSPGLLNNSEISSFTHFAPAFLVLYPYLWYWMRKGGNPQRIVGDVLVVSLLIQLVFLLVPLPEWLVKVTLLSYANRMQIVYGLTATIFTVWSFAMIKKTEMPHKILTGGIISLIYGIMSWPAVLPMLLPGFLKIVQYRAVIYAMAVAMALGLWLVFTRWRQIFYCVLICWTAVSGMLVNPLMQGTASITDYPFVDVVRKEVEDNPDALWITTGYNQIPGLLLANGARVFNAVNFYPDFEKWKMIDPDLEEFKTENRYAHIKVTLTGNAQSSITLPSPDMIQIALTPDDLKKLNIRYLAIAGDPQQLDILDLFDVPYEILFADAENGDLILDLQPDRRREEAIDAAKKRAEKKKEEAAIEEMRRSSYSEKAMKDNIFPNLLDEDEKSSDSSSAQSASRTSNSSSRNDFAEEKEQAESSESQENRKDTEGENDADTSAQNQLRSEGSDAS